MMTIAICVLCICISVYLAYTCEEIKNKKAKIFLGILTGVLFITSFGVFFLTVGNIEKEKQVFNSYTAIVYCLIALVLICLRIKIKKLYNFRKTQNITKINEEV